MDEKKSAAIMAVDDLLTFVCFQAEAESMDGMAGLMYMVGAARIIMEKAGIDPRTASVHTGIMVEKDNENP